MNPRPVRLEKPISINDVISGQGFTFETNFEDANVTDDEECDDAYTPKLSTQMDNVSLDDEDSYDCNQEPFEDLEKQMVNVDENGYVKKRIFREGRGDVIPNNAKVNFDYKAFFEYEAGSYDSTYRRRKPHVCRLGNGELMPGLDLAVSSMKTNERAQFIIHYQMGYGKLGCPPLVGPKTSLLFEVDLHTYVELAPGTQNDEENPLEVKSDFVSNFDRSVKLCDEANYLIKNEKKYKAAIRLYNDAVNHLSSVLIQNEEQSEKFVQLIVRLYTNLAISHMQLDNYKKTCINCQEVYKLCKTYRLDVSDKIYYNHAKALYGLNELERAEEKLRVAAGNTAFLKPDMKVMDLYQKIQEAKAKQHKSEVKLARAMFQTDLDVVDEGFKQLINDLCHDLLDKTKMSKLPLPDKLNDKEIAYVRKTTTDLKLQIIDEGSNDGKKKYFITK